MKDMKKFFIGVALFTAGVAGGYHLNYSRSSESNFEDHIVTDTITVYDTCKIEVRTPVDSICLRYITRHLPVLVSGPDSTNQEPVDSVSVKLPIIRKIYADSTYRAVVSGYEPRLDSLTIFQPMTTVSKNVVIRDKSPRWSIGITAGASLTPRGMQPALTIGVSYRLVTF